MIFTFKKIEIKLDSTDSDVPSYKIQKKNKSYNHYNSFLNDKDAYSFQNVKNNFDKNLQKWQLLGCSVCQSCRLYKHGTPNENLFICPKCAHKKNKTDSNYFKLHGPNKMPKELEQYKLSFAEEQLISLVYVNQYIMVRGKGVYASKGHCINFAQDISGVIKIAKIIPRLEEDIPLIIIRKTNSDLTCFDLKLRRKHITVWINYLINNKIPGYKNAEISNDNLELIPENGYLTKFRQIETDEDINTLIDSIKTDYDILKNENKFENNNEKISGLFKKSLSLNEINKIKDELPIDTNIDNEQNIMYQTGVAMPNETNESESTLKADFINQHPILSYPNHSLQPLNDYKTAYLATMAFPTLFPDGHGDPYDIHEHSNRETFLEKIKHLINYHEIVNKRKMFRFAVHSRFILWIYNIQYRHATLSQGTFYLKQHQDQANLTIDQLKTLIEKGDKSVIKNIQRYMASIPGTPSFWFQLRCDLSCIIKIKGPPSAFFTLSFPTHYDPYLHELLHIPKGSTYMEIDNYLKQAPHIVNEYFVHKFKEFQTEWLEKRLKGLPEYGGWIWSRFEWQFRDVIHVHGLIKFGNGSFDGYKASEICIEGKNIYY